MIRGLTTLPGRRNETVTRRALVALLAVLTLLGAPAADARTHAHRRAGRTRRCHSDKQCPGAVCNDARRCCPFGDFACGANCCDPLTTSACCGDRACVDIYADNGNCGACGNVCSGGKSCQLGSCVCPSGQTDCGGVCKDLTSDPANCGACGKACGADFSCVDSECRCTDPERIPCNGTCVDPYRDRDNCGLCGRACPPDQDCLSGNCQSGCPPCEEPVDNICVLIEPGKDTMCNGTCVDTLTDPSNCGACGTVCSTGNSCVQGHCTCPNGLEECAGVCVDTQHDPANCGECGNRCPSLSCRSGTCDLCPVTYTTCPIYNAHTTVACCGPDTPNCCFGSRGGGGCCTDAESCCTTTVGDGYCCPADTHCCSNSMSYPCLPAGTPCPS